MAKLIIKRSSEYMSILSAIGVYIDGKRIGAISYGQTKEFAIEPGEHELKARIDWCSSNSITFNVEDGGIQKVNLSGFKYGKWYPQISIILMIFIFVIAMKIDEHYWIFGLLIFLIELPLLYYLTLGSIRYMRLQKQ